MKYYSIRLITERNDDWEPVYISYIIQAENFYSAWYKLYAESKEYLTLEFDSHFNISSDGYYMDESDTEEKAKDIIASKEEAPIKYIK